MSRTKETITLCTFQPRAVYDEILKTGVYRLSRVAYNTFKGKTEYIPYRRQEKYERLMQASGLLFDDTMPIWAWHKEEGGKPVTPDMYKNALAIARRNDLPNEKSPEMVGMFLEVQPEEVYLTNFYNWDCYMFCERHIEDAKGFANWSQEEQGWYLAELAEEDYHFAKIRDIEGPVQTQGILSEIRKEMITFVLKEQPVT